LSFSPTQRTLRALRNRGLVCEIVEKFNCYAGSFGQRKDLFGIIDIIALSPDGVIGIQSCGNSFSEHYRKILESEYLVDWLNTPGTSLELWAWRKCKRKLDKGYSEKLYWTPRTRIITLEDLDENHIG